MQISTMKFYRLLLFASLLNCIFALEAEISQKVKIKNKIYTCLFKIYYKGDTCQANSTVSCSPKVKGTAKDVKLALDNGTLIFIEKLQLKGKKAKIMGCKAINPDKPGDTSHSDFTNQICIEKLVHILQRVKEKMFHILKRVKECSFKSLGCWKDTGNRAIATLEGTDSRLTGNFGERQNALEICFQVAKSKGYPAFAVQAGGWCAGSSTALDTYKKYGKTTGCNEGKGGAWANDVYQITCDGCSPAPDSWGGDCSKYVWACTSSSFPWYKEVCSTTCNYCDRCGIENTNSKHISEGSASAKATGGSGNGKRIIGGSETAPNQYPWMVRLDPPGCGGALITDKHILTAKHCVDEGHDAQPGTKVKVGVHNQNDPNDYQEATIKEVKWPGSTLNGQDHDFAMIILDQPVDLNDKKIGTVCLPSTENEDYTGKEATAMGWGDFINSGTGQSAVLNHVEVTVVQGGGPNILNTEVGKLNNGVQTVCHGDSGGPLVNRGSNGRWTIIGTANAFSGSPEGEGCLGATLNHWNKITAHLTWIKDIIDN